MAIHKLHLDDFFETDYELIAIHCTLEDYRLAYLLNRQLAVLFSKCREYVSVSTKEGEAFFSKFTYEDSYNDILWTLIQNRNEITASVQNSEQNLFLDMDFEIETSVFLLPELKKADYLLKVENNHDTVELSEIVKKINSIDQVAAVYEVETDKIKSKHNLIF